MDRQSDRQNKSSYIKLADRKKILKTKQKIRMKESGKALNKVRKTD